MDAENWVTYLRCSNVSNYFFKLDLKNVFSADGLGFFC